MSKTILITGSSTGIGHATAKHFQSQGWNVIATMRKPENETELNTLDNVLVTRLDVQDQDSIASAIAAGIEQFGGIDVLLNNAGYGLAGSFESISRESIKRQFDVNVFGLMDVTRAVIPHMRERGSGLILNVSSVGGRITFPLFSEYHATKWAVEGFSESLHYELAPLGIGVKIIEPGGVQTDFGGRSLDFQHDQSLTAYNGVVGAVMAAFQDPKRALDYSTAEYAADKIFAATTDGSDQLRYPVGEDAHQLLGARASMDDANYLAMMKKSMGLV